VATPLLITTLVVSSAAAVGIPQTAHAFARTGTAEQRTLRLAGSDWLDHGTRAAEVSRSSDRTALAGARIVQGEHLRPKPSPWVLPVSGYHLTARFGEVSGLWSHFHTGLDFAAPTGTEIRSIGPGRVVSTGFDGAYGNKTVVRLDEGTVLWYCHQNAFAVRPGQRVRAGQLIGYVGSTGNTTGPHLHLEVHPHGGGPVDPQPWLVEHHLHP
jgi:murein DD-endopeptidase MepM/ murein hydrolase activator NlpD